MSDLSFLCYISYGVLREAPNPLRLAAAPQSRGMMRLMRALGLTGVRRGRKVRTLMPGEEGRRAGSRWRRDFHLVSPERALTSGLALTWERHLI
jgi:hypothetical protein